MKIRYLLPVALLLSVPVTGTAANRDFSKLYDECVNAAGTINNGVVDACASGVSEKVKPEINRLYKLIHRRLLAEAPEDATQFEAAQKSWLSYRNLHCQLAGRYVGSPMVSYCPMLMNVQRVGELQEMANE